MKWRKTIKHYDIKLNNLLLLYCMAISCLLVWQWITFATSNSVILLHSTLDWGRFVIICIHHLVYMLWRICLQCIGFYYIDISTKCTNIQYSSYFTSIYIYMISLYMPSLYVHSLHIPSPSMHSRLTLYTIAVYAFIIYPFTVCAWTVSICT